MTPRPTLASLNESFFLPTRAPGSSSYRRCQPRRRPGGRGARTGQRHCVSTYCAQYARQKDHAVRLGLLRVVHEHLRLGLLEHKVKVLLRLRASLLSWHRVVLNKLGNGRLFAVLARRRQAVHGKAAHSRQKEPAPKGAVEACVSVEAAYTHLRQGTPSSAQSSAATSWSARHAICAARAARQPSEERQRRYRARCGPESPWSFVVDRSDRRLLPSPVGSVT